MTDENATGQEQSGNEKTQSQPTPPASPPAKKPRSPVERLVVWGAIGVLIVIAGIEGQAKYGYSQSLDALKERLDEIDDSQDRPDLAVTDLDELLTGYVTISEPAKEGSAHFVECKWKSLFKNYLIQVKVSSEKPDAVVLSYSTPDALPEQKPVTPVPAGEGEEMPETPGAGGEVAGGPSGKSKGKSKGKGGPGGGSRRQGGMLGRLDQEDVQAELKLTEEQTDKLDELRNQPGPDRAALQEMSAEERSAFFQERRQKTLASIKEILNEEQFQRLRQLTLQDAGISAIGQSDVQAELKITDKQKEEISQALQTRRDALRSLGSAPPESRKLYEDRLDQQLVELLTDEQKAAWKGLLGAPASGQEPEIAEKTSEKKKQEAPKTAKEEKDSAETKKEKTAVKGE